MNIISVSLYNHWNFGTVLQNYALNKFLIDSGYDAKVLNYICTYECSSNDLKDRLRFYVSMWKLRLGFFGRIHKTKRFCERSIEFTKRYKTKTDIKKGPPKADLYIVGSDQVWNPDFGGEFYHLGWLRQGSKISYSSCIGRTDIAQDELEKLATDLHDFRYVSVRDADGRKILTNAGIKNVELVMDPVFLLDQEYYKKWTLPKKNDNYVLLLSYKQRDEGIKKVLQKIQNKTGYDLIEIATGKHRYPELNSKHFGNLGIEEILSYISNAEFVLTTSFHTIAFCLIFNKQFAVLPAYENDSRLLGILKSVGLQDRLITDSECDIEDLMKPIDYIEVNKKMKAMIDNSKRWLINAIEDCKKEL